MTVPFPKKEVGQLWKGFFIMPYTEKLDNLHGRPMVNIVSGENLPHSRQEFIYLTQAFGLAFSQNDGRRNQSYSVQSRDQVLHSQRRSCTSKTIGLLVRRHIVAGEFHYIGKEASTRWAGGPDLSMMAEAGALDPADETCREYERVVDPKYLDEIRAEAKQFSTKLLSRQSRVAECAIRISRMEKTRSSLVLCES